VDTIETLARKALSRRSFLAGAGTAAAATLISGCGDDTPITITNPTSSYSEADILNFALNLEYLEAEFYLRAATGSGLSATDAGTGAGAVTGATTAVPGLTVAQSAYLNEFAQTELSHVRLLRQALGPAAVARPAIDLVNSFNALATAAGIGSTFNPFASFAFFLVGGFIFEDVGVTAYTGAAPLLTTTSTLNTAAGIQATEAYHAASLRTNIVALASPAGSDQTALMAAQKVSALRATLGGGNETSPTSGVTAGVLTSTTTGSTIVAAAPSTSVGYARTPSQVLHIVYGTAGSGAGVSQGGFFPSGVNGTIKTTTA
jgi:hypothetical protein